jgi:hypothetical protein
MMMYGRVRYGIHMAQMEKVSVTAHLFLEVLQIYYYPKLFGFVRSIR